MKRILCYLFVSAILIACNSERQPVAPYAIEYTPPPTDGDLILQDRKYRERAGLLNEENMYQDSLVKIEDKFRNEYLRYQMCLEVNGNKSSECKELLTGFCRVDLALDTRQGYHIKPYCRKK